MYVQRNIEARSCDRCRGGRATSVIYCECVCVCGSWVSSMQCACAVLYFHLWPVWLYDILSTLSHKGQDLRKKVTEHKMCLISCFQPNALVYCIFSYSSTCFMPYCAHHEEDLPYTGCNRRNGPDFGRVFLRSNYTDITQNTYIQSSMVTEILVREV